MLTPSARAALIAVLGALALPAPQATAQSDFAESFENNGADQGNGPANLVAQGWIFRNQSDPVNGSAWYDGDNFGGQPFDGDGYLASSGLATDFFGGAVSTWAILPDLDGLQAGDVVTLWVFGGGGYSHDTFLDIRRSAGGLSTGSGPDGVGDFTEVLFTAELPLATQGYHRVTTTVPADGRLAIRFHAPYLRTFAGEGASISIDTLSVGPPQAGPCGIAIPGPGQTAVWTAAGNPYTICQDLLIPPGGRVEVEPGVEIHFSSGKLRVEGEFSAAGTADEPIEFIGGGAFGDSLEIGDAGQADIAHAVIGTRIWAGGENAATVVTDSKFVAGGDIAGVADLFVIERCEFDGGTIGGVTPAAGSVRLTDSTFVNGSAPYLTGLLYLDNVSVDGAPIRIHTETGAHPILLDSLSVTNHAAGAGMELSGPNFLLGDNIVLQNNLYPLELNNSMAGLLPGSKLPTTGNANNHVPVEAFVLAVDRQWADTGLPYVVAGEFPINYGGTINVEPGATIRFGPDAGAFIVGAAEVGLQGTRDNPIILESQFPGARWFGLKWVDDFDAKARHTIFRGGQITVQSDGGVMDLVNCTVSDSLEGTASVTGGIVRLFGSRIVNNQVGMVTTTSGRIEADGSVQPSIFEGNTKAIEYNNISSTPYLRYNWWGDPTGPSAPLWPDGQGDFVDGVHPAAFNPFLTAPPKQDDDAPTVRMQPVYFTAQAGDKIILRWESADDDAVVAHRVEFADHDFPSEFRVIAYLPAHATTYEFTAPIVQPTNNYPTPSAIRVVAVDSAGQEGWDKSVIRIPYQEDWTVVEQAVSDPGPSHPHDNVDICWTPGGNASVWVMMDGIGFGRSSGGSNTGCLPIGATLPYSSTDLARVVVTTTFGAGGRLHYSFSDYFPIRPDPRFGDAPPSVSVTAPAAGASFPGGGTVQVAWEASDDEGLRTFKIQASYDAGRTWHGVADGLQPDARSFAWDLPESAGIPDVRVRVVAVDHRFQYASALSGIFAITPDAACDADFNADGLLNFFDVASFIAAFNAQNPAADIAEPFGQFNFFDIAAFIDRFNAGCP